MKMKSFANTAGAAALALAMWITPGTVQGQPLYDRIHVNLPYQITLGEKVLQPGEYTIQRLPDNGGARILLFYTDNGMKFETSAMTIPALDINTARDTKLILNHVGDDYYIHKIWVQGKDYGYELPMPKTLKMREKETMTATTVTATSTDTSKVETAENIKVEEVEKTEVAVATPVTAEVETKAVTQETAVVEPVPVVTAESNTADRAVEEPKPEPTPAPAMPHTAANWLMMLLSGGTLSGAGMMLRRKR